MSDKSSIQWTDATWSPIAAFRLDDGKRGWHCEKVSEGCRRCYAERLNGRKLQVGTGLPYTRSSRDLVEIRAVNLDVPLRWRRPRRIFVESMSDLFADFVPVALIDRVMAVMVHARRHTFQVLTKRPENALRYFDGITTRDGGLRLAAAIAREWPGDHIPRTQHVMASLVNHGGDCLPLPNVWLGVSVEDRAALPRLDMLRATPAALRFVSFEPLLEDLGAIDLTGISWAIWGGESGSGARPCGVSWLRSGISQCRKAGVAPFLKQVGAHYVDEVNGVGGVLARPPLDFVPPIRHLRDRKGGDMAEWPEDLRVREFPGGGA